MKGTAIFIGACKNRRQCSLYSITCFAFLLILEKMLKKLLREYGLDSSGSGQNPVVGCCEHGNEPLGFTKSREFLD
jgi:hypothetical protein